LKRGVKIMDSYGEVVVDYPDDAPPRKMEATRPENKTFNYEFFTQIFRQKYRNL